MAASSAAPSRRPPVIDLCSSDDEDDEVVAVKRPRSVPRWRRQHLPPPQQDPSDHLGNIPATGTHTEMSTPHAPNRDEGQIIIIDGEEVFLPDMPPDPFNALDIPSADSNEQAATPPALNPPGGETLIIDGEEVFIPDSPEPQAASFSAPQPIEQPITLRERMASPIREFTEDSCLSRVLAIFPDVSHDHVMQLYADMTRNTHNNLDGAAKFERIVEKIISSDYPKQGKGKQPLKRKREDDDGTDDSERWAPDRIAEPLHQKAIANILKADFPEFTRKDIDQNVKQHKHLFQTYVALANTKDMNDSTIVFRGRQPGASLADADTIAANSTYPVLIEELRAARTRVKRDRAERAVAKQKRENEEINLQRAVQAGETSECQVCFDDLPMNRQVHCNGEVAHFTCFECMTNYIKTEVGDSRCRVLCTAGCGSSFAPAQLRLLEDKQLLGKLEQLQQEKEIRDAGLDDLEECPFCEYKAILPPIEQDFEFRCANPECEKVSCRRCKAISHIPQSCEEHAKDNKLDSRHKIEEAMTAAMIRSCNKCKKQFIKDYGCNKMSCPSCGHLQCYVCSASLKDYTHFDNVPGGRPQGGAASSNAKKCPLYDNVEERHEREVKEAEAAARAQILDDNPDVSEEDLQIKVSETVKKADADRVRRAGQGLPGGYGGYGGAGLLRVAPHRPLGLDADDDGESDDDPEDQEDRIQEVLEELDDFEEIQAALNPRPPVIDANRLAQIRAAQVRQRQLMQMALMRRHQPHPGLGGHIAGHGNQAHLARPPQPAHARGLAHRVPVPVQGFIPVYGFNGAQRPVPLPHPQLQTIFQLPPAPPQPAPQPAPQVPREQAFGDNGPGRILGARNNGLPGPQGLFDAFAEDPFGGGDADPFGFARMAVGPQFNEMAAPQMDWGNAREQQRQALQNMHNRAGGMGEVRELHRDDPHRYNRGRGFPGAPQAG